ncbi:ectomycorrhiza-regulated esterase [Punctularia strigosozonata HHB-11173 SS5]|uniref:ectomycorrhiza-regulated esterase n=1 Tax=Punctularia strigosozonata (strain HHB-11173) TaxID=741275 RepID=UPI00044166A2|nr:ectomycorrhiza-regulated esterase [Punctularia strigosozonata HHB-11173 SS5]EIN12490.1 ectomycorrhiza-regulated esterase [Punctularia strigosozonata HHB-11173 SS5]
MSTRTSTRLSVPHTFAPDCPIAGVLERLEPDKPTQGRKIALILHGTLRHKDYLYQRGLAQRLPLDSFRFDFRGNHETPGTWNTGALAEDVEDLQVVADYLIKEFGYVIDLLVGHSRGSIIGYRWVCTAEEAKTVRGFVNCSGRYRMHKMLERFNTTYKEQFEARGFYEWNVRVAGKPVTGIIRPKDVEAFATWDNSLVWDRFPAHVHALTIHGIADTTVPPYDATIWARALGSRSPGTHNLHYVDEADHNFTGKRDEVTNAICDWWASAERGELTTGILYTGVRAGLESFPSKL